MIEMWAANKMKSLTDRANTMLYGFVYGCLVFGLVNYLMAYYGSHNVQDVTFELSKIGTFINDKNYDEDAASFQFNFKGDLRGLFNWNTNIIFLSIQCEFETKKGYKNEMTVWDQRIPRESTEHHQLDLRDEWTEYWMTDQNHSFRDKEIKVFLRWE
jgi:hypothetical protein